MPRPTRPESLRLGLKSAIPVPVKRLLKDPLATMAPRRTGYRRLRRSVAMDPQTFSEKVRYRMAFDRRPILRTFVDKVACRDYIADRVGASALPRLYGVYESAREIPWGKLPREFALKASHGSGAVALVSCKGPRTRLPLPSQAPSWRWRGLIHPDYLDRQAMTRLAEGWLKMSYEITNEVPEWAYSEVPPRLIIEELLKDQSGGLPKDYKFYMFDGTCGAISLDIDRFEDHTRAWFDSDWNRLDLETLAFSKAIGDHERPENLQAMLKIASALSAGIDFIRVDLYDTGDRVVVGELTSYPGAGRMTFKPQAFDSHLGSYWNLEQ